MRRLIITLAFAAITAAAAVTSSPAAAAVAPAAHSACVGVVCAFQPRHYR